MHGIARRDKFCKRENSLLRQLKGFSKLQLKTGFVGPTLSRKPWKRNLILQVHRKTREGDRENSGGNSRRRIPDQQENGDLQGEHKEKSAGLTYQHGGGMAGYLMSTAELRAPPPTSTLLQQKKGTATRASGKKNKNKMRLIHLEKNNEMWNTAIHQHNQQTSCRNPQFTQDKEKRWGIGIKQSLKCTNCNSDGCRKKEFTQTAF